MKDLFSGGPGQYRAFRPTYPAELYNLLLSLVPGKECAWDCGTGNGQVAQELAKHFRRVEATDISKQQITQAPILKNVRYSIRRAEDANFPDNTFDLITVGQAAHWFDFDLFYREVSRTLKPNGIVALFGYGLIRTFPGADRIISGFYENITGPYWDEERKYVANHYRTIPFPFREITNEELESTFDWTFEHLAGYLGTWSAVKKYREQTGKDPLNLIHEKLQTCWNGQTRTVRFPVFMRVGKIEK